jgi:ATP-dependent Clp protease ATP-binding subunit ClpB
MTSNVGADIIQSYMERLPLDLTHAEENSLSSVIPSEAEGRVEESIREKLLSECRSEVLDVLKRTVRPEFLNRIDEVIMFEPLSQSDIRDILRMQMADLRSKLAENGVNITFTQDFEDYMSTKGYEPAYGARPIKRLMQKELVNLLAKSILDGHVRRDSVITIDLQDGRIVIR